MTARRHRIDFSLRRRRNDLSNTSSGSISPPVPILQSPVTFQAFASVSVSEATLKQKNKLERDPVRPSMFLEEKDDDEAPNSALTGGAPLDVKPVHIERKSVEEKPMTRTKSQYFEDAFSTRGPLTSPRTQISQDSVVVVEIKTNTKVREGGLQSKFPVTRGLFLGYHSHARRRSKKWSHSSRTFRPIWHASFRNPKPL